MNALPRNLTPDLNIVPEVTAFFDEPTNTISYVVKDPTSDACAVIDSVMDIDYAAGRITYDGADRIIDFIKTNNLRLEWLIETHVHADHLSAAPYIQEALGGKIGIEAKLDTGGRDTARERTAGESLFNFLVNQLSSLEQKAAKLSRWARVKALLGGEL